MGLKNSAMLCVYLMRKLLYWCQLAIDKQERVMHIHLTNRTEAFLQQPTEVQIMEHHCQLKGDFGLSYPPVIASGGQYDLSFNAQSNRELIQPDCVVVQLGGRYKGYNTNCVRTMLINPPNDVRGIYNSLLSCLQELVDQLKPGIMLGEVYRAVRSHFGTCLPKHLHHFPDCLGWGIGLEQREDFLAINRTSRVLAQVGMCFFIQVWVDQVTYTVTEPKQFYTLVVGDTVCIAAQESNLVLTNPVEKVFKKIAYYFDEFSPPNTKPDLKSGFMRLRRQGVAIGKGIEQDTKSMLEQHLSTSRTFFREIQQKELVAHQELLKQQKQFELEERLFGKDWPTSIHEKRTNMLGLQSYKPHEAFPERAQRSRLFIDTKVLSVLLPFESKDSVYQHIPFHALTIKSVEVIPSSILKQPKQEEGATQTQPLHELHIRFWTTENSFNSRVYPEISSDQIFIKEFVYRSSNLERLEDNALLIKNLQRQARLFSLHEETSDKLEKVNNIQPLLEMEILMRTRTPIVLKNVHLRPALSAARGISGSLECHLNGFRYISSRDEEVIVPFKFVKHFIYQQALDEIIGAIHLHLHNPIIVGRRRVNDI